MTECSPQCVLNDCHCDITIDMQSSLLQLNVLCLTTLMCLMEVKLKVVVVWQDIVGQ